MVVVLVFPLLRAPDCEMFPPAVMVKMAPDQVLLIAGRVRFALSKIRVTFLSPAREPKLESVTLPLVVFLMAILV